MTISDFRRSVPVDLSHRVGETAEFPVQENFSLFFYNFFNMRDYQFRKLR